MRKAIICIAAIVLVIMLLCPPWRMAYSSGGTPVPCGHHWLFLPPQTASFVARTDPSGTQRAFVTAVPVVDFTRFGLQIAVLITVAVTIVTIVPPSKARDKGRQHAAHNA